MNKKLLILLPAMALVLAGCGGNGSSSSSSSSSSSESTSESTSESSSSTSTEVVDTDYGTKAHPLTVAQFLTNVDKLVAKTAGTFSAKKFYVSGQASSNAAFGSAYSQYETFFMKDAQSDTSSAKIQRASQGTGITADHVYQNDSVLVSGYAEYYSNAYSIFPDTSKTDGAAEVLSLTAGTSSVTANVGDHLAISSTLESSYTNGTVVTVTLTIDSGYKVDSFKANGGVIAVESDGSYKVTIGGDTAIVITSAADLPESDIPAGTYQVTISNTNSGMTDAALTSALTVSLPIATDTSSVIYKKLSVTFSAGCKNQSSYSEFFLPKGGSMSIATPNGTITTALADFYRSQSCSAYAASSATGTALTGVAGTVVNNHAPVTFSPANANLTFGLASTAAYTQSFYSLVLTIVVA